APPRPSGRSRRCTVVVGFRCFALHDRRVHRGRWRPFAVHALTGPCGPLLIEGRNMDFNLPERGERLRRQIRRFVNEVLIPLEADAASYDEHENIGPDLLCEMRERARNAGLWALQMPVERG